MLKNLFRQVNQCPRCYIRLKEFKNTKYLKCPECGKLFENEHFQTPDFDELEFSPLFDLEKIPESAYKIAYELMQQITKVELWGNNEAAVWYHARVCQSENETVLLSNLTHLNVAEQSFKFNLKYAACGNYHKSCDYAYACPIRLAAYLYLVREKYGEAYLKEVRKQAKKNAAENDTRKAFVWDINNHTSEYIPTKLLNFVEKLLDNNYITISHKAVVDEQGKKCVQYIASKHLFEIPLDKLMKMSQKSLRKLLTTDLTVKNSEISYIGIAEQSAIPHLAKYVEYLRRNNSYKQFYKKQLSLEKQMKKDSANFEKIMVEKIA